MTEVLLAEDDVVPPGPDGVSPERVRDCAYGRVVDVRVRRLRLGTGRGRIRTVRRSGRRIGP
ncbi:hypothetical protein [Streptomyces sp. WAC08241]|uniref:hypothetical protein n=1 Tax=Streptomyces sp. WAC08241 TaxID=2487421 RepID=UPI000F7922EF|nr:hypothetical protein [Streptomyces sp. WAC08241]RSS37148.1 hypothetical protein EF906_23730 [Streptomyces sp. WAC08241]